MSLNSPYFFQPALPLTFTPDTLAYPISNLQTGQGVSGGAQDFNYTPGMVGQVFTVNGKTYRFAVIAISSFTAVGNHAANILLNWKDKANNIVSAASADAPYSVRNCPAGVLRVAITSATAHSIAGSVGVLVCMLISGVNIPVLSEATAIAGGQAFRSATAGNPYLDAPAVATASPVLLCGVCRTAPAGAGQAGFYDLDIPQFKV